MKYQSIDHGHDKVLSIIAEAVEKTRTALNIQMHPIQIEMLVDDIYEVYQIESIEDVLQCLKKGRVGLYGFGINRRDTLNMILIREWMTQHLERKAKAREEKHLKLKVETNEPLPNVDYEAYKERNKNTEKPKKRQVIINPNENHQHMENQNEIYQAIQAKLYQEEILTDDENAFLRFHKCTVINKVIHHEI